MKIYPVSPRANNESVFPFSETDRVNCENITHIHRLTDWLTDWTTELNIN